MPPSPLVPPSVARAGGSPLDLGSAPTPGPSTTDRATPPPPPPAHAGRSALDLGGPGGTASVGTPGTTGSALDLPGGGPVTARRPPAAARVSEHSSRHRQRAERVAELDDGHPATIWTSEERGAGAMTVTLRWTPLTTSTGLPRPSNLHLGCLWQAGDGAAGLLHSLGRATSAPGPGARRQVLRLAGRDEQDGQTLYVDLASLPTFRRFFVVAYGLRAVPPWAQLRPTLTVGTAGGEHHLAMRLGEAPAAAQICVAASFHVVDDDLVIRREDDFVAGTLADAAARYGWSLDWNPDGMATHDDHTHDDQ
ncbi:Stress protein (fragment) [Frankia canadensis]|uniref:Stress protein n=1 Tax=Frankia canadensis TaxID=1836972 RepID=A0A2I2KK59_9ACTN